VVLRVVEDESSVVRWLSMLDVVHYAAIQTVHYL
jgi:hypothetical protein